MFEILDRKGNITIRLTRGDSGTILTSPTIDVNDNKIYDPDNGDRPIELGDDDYILFAVGSPSGRKYISKLITKSDYDEEHNLTINLEPKDTVHLQSFSYNFSFTYFQNNGENAYTYAQGIFEVLETVGTIDDLPNENPGLQSEDNFEICKGNVVNEE